MQLSQVQQSFSQVDQCIQDAARLCQSAEAPQELKDCIAELKSETIHAREMILDPDDESEIVECIDAMEELGDEAMDLCRSASNVDAQLRDAVKKAHDELSELKHSVH